MYAADSSQFIDNRISDHIELLTKKKKKNRHDSIVDVSKATPMNSFVWSLCVCAVKTSILAAIGNSGKSKKILSSKVFNKPNSQHRLPKTPTTAIAQIRREAKRQAN